MHEAIGHQLPQMIAEGAVPARLDPDAEARTIFAVVDGMLMYSVLDAGFCPAETLADRVWGVILDRLLGGGTR